ncbi:hypothetical protein N7470_001711 [Penicillium chermesinum]|nr:hypothetical protein N7470_001711 [Penicillium chermesinum]
MSGHGAEYPETMALRLRKGCREVTTPVEHLKAARLIWHFEEFTSDTLLFGKRFWVEEILPLAFHHDYLMHAILAIASSHLSFLLPQARESERSMKIHLGHTLPGFRKAVGTVASIQDTDVLIACGFLLLYYMWSVPFFNDEGNPSLSADSDGLFWFALGLKEVTVTAYETQTRAQAHGLFQDIAIPQYVKVLADIRNRTENAICSYDFNKNFFGNLESPCTQNDATPPPSCREINALERLARSSTS